MAREVDTLPHLTGLGMYGPFPLPPYSYDIACCDPVWGREGSTCAAIQVHVGKIMKSKWPAFNAHLSGAFLCAYVQYSIPQETVQLSSTVSDYPTITFSLLLVDIQIRLGYYKRHLPIYQDT